MKIRDKDIIIMVAVKDCNSTKYNIEYDKYPKNKDIDPKSRDVK